MPVWRIIASTLLIVLAGCAPAYDWREVVPDAAHYRALLPAKPAQASREINLDGLQVTMAMQGARVDEVAFTVAEVRLPDDSMQTRERALQGMRAGMLRNVGADPAKASVTAIAVPVRPLADARPGTRATATAPGWRVDAEGSAAGRPVRLHAVFAARGTHAWQAVVIGTDPDTEQVRMFLDGFALID